jgi:hypothetical protein
MMDIVTSCNRESPLDFRANPQIRGPARRPDRRMTASKNSGMPPSKTMAMPRRRIHAEQAVITALISIASSVVGAAQLPVTTWREPTHQVTAGMQKVLTAMIRPAPLGEITPEPQIPAPTVKPVAPPVAAPPPHAEQPLSPPRQPAAPPPQQEAPPPPPEAPAPAPEAPAPAPEGPAPAPAGPAPPEETPPPQPPPRGHVQLAP